MLRNFFYGFRRFFLRCILDNAITEADDRYHLAITQYQCNRRDRIAYRRAIEAARVDRGR